MKESSRAGRWAVLLVAGLIAGAAPAATEDRDRNRAVRQARQDARAHRGSGSWRVELFGRGGGHVLAASFLTELSFPRFGTGEPAETVSGESSDWALNYLVAGGVRLARERSGVEVAWTFAPNPLLTPSVAEPGPVLPPAPGVLHGGDDDYGYDSRAGMLVVQAFHEAPVFGPDIRLFVGLGGGWLRVRDEGSDQLMADGDVRLTQARDKALIGGSVGVTVRAGNLIVRPRVDIYWSGALLTVLTTPGLTISERVRPTFYLLSVDFGFAFRR